MTKGPKISFRVMSVIENINLLAMFINSELNSKDNLTIDYLKNKYPKLSLIDFNNMDEESIKEILKSLISDELNQELSEVNISDFQNNWNLINDEVINNLNSIFNTTWSENITCRVGIMISCPRYINDRMFDLNYELCNSTFIEVVIHELCHFLFFKKWQELFNDYDESHYNEPHLIWYLSEAMIDPLLNNRIFTKYTNQDIKSYQIFYETYIKDLSIIDKLRTIIKDNSVEDAIKKSYLLFKENKNIIIKDNIK